MKKNSNIFQEDIKVPEIVLQKADEAFARIQTEGRSAMTKNSQTEKKKRGFWKNPAAVAACASDYFEKYNNIPEALKGTEKENIVDAVLAELEKRNSAATQAEEQRIEAEKREILDDLYLYGM